jgi:hypothetical protein
MSDAAAQQEWHSKWVRHWLLAILRFAVTLEQADRAAALAVAEEMDRVGWRSEDQPTCKFFGRTSTELSSAIADDKEDPKTVAVLRLHLKRIDDHRLRRALEAAIELGDFSTRQETPRSLRNTSVATYGKVFIADC